MIVGLWLLGMYYNGGKCISHNNVETIRCFQYLQLGSTYINIVVSGISIRGWGVPSFRYTRGNAEVNSKHASYAPSW